MRALVALSAALLVCPGCVLDASFDYKYSEQEHKHFATSGVPDVALKTHDGRIEVRRSDGSNVDVTIEKRASTKESLADLVVEASQDGNRISVEVRSKHGRLGDWHFGMSPNARLIVTVPAETNLSAHSGDGSIDVERIAGRMDLSSGDGRIRASELNGDVTVHTGDGSVALDGTFRSLNASSGDGSVRVHTDASPSGDWVVTTGDGSITLEVPDGFNAGIDAHTGDGRVRVEDVSVSDVTGEIRRNSLKGQLGSGGKLVKLRTGDGSITLKRN